MTPKPLWLVFGLGLLLRLFTSRGQHGTGVGEEVGWESQGLGGSWTHGRCGQDPSDSSSLGLVRLFRGTIALCIHLAGVMEGSSNSLILSSPMCALCNAQCIFYISGIVVFMAINSI